MDPIIPQTALPNNEISHGPSDNEEPSQLDEGEVAEEIWREYSWLPTLLAENETKAWGTAYRVSSSQSFDMTFTRLFSFISLSPTLHIHS